jgi:C4-dicarboxylate-specific signal transduction histidine kinase
MLNLLVNAGEALEELRSLKPEVTIQAIREGEQMRVTVTDNGPGIPLPVMPRMFEPFFTTKLPGKGTGLGLALSREYVESFGGTLAVNNVLPHGAQFTLMMKLTPMTGETPLPDSLDLGPQRQTLLDHHRPKVS